MSKLKDKIQKVHDTLFKKYGDRFCPLEHESPFQLLVAVILSAQCRDERVNKITKLLFKQYPDAESIANSEESAIAKIIKPCGLFRNKSKAIIGSAKAIVNNFNGKVPQSMEELLTLPGVGRKSANVVLGNAFNIPGFPVDTHVTRISNLLEIVKTKNPDKIEQIITKNIDPKYWTNFSHMIIQHGRDTCRARTPDCANCVLFSLCPSAKNIDN